MDQAEQPTSELLQQIMSDVADLTARHGWETAPRGRMAYLLRKRSNWPKRFSGYPRAPLVIRCCGSEIYDVLWNACDLARLTGIDVVEAAAGKRAVNADRGWRDSGPA